jgi:hypothetical protein
MTMAKMTDAELLRLLRADADAIAGMDDRTRRPSTLYPIPDRRQPARP